MAIQQYTIQKPVWTEADFEQMGWHDVHIHAVAFRPEIFELWLDIDYIFGWVDPHGYLFSPLGITNYYWQKTSNGVVNTLVGMALRPRDMAKIDYLFLNGGCWQGKQIQGKLTIQDTCMFLLSPATVSAKMVAGLQ
jgi:hypothetical protein